MIKFQSRMHTHGHLYSKQAKNLVGLWTLLQANSSPTLFMEGKHKNNWKSAETNLMSYFSEYLFFEVWTDSITQDFSPLVSLLDSIVIIMDCEIIFSQRWRKQKNLFHDFSVFLLSPTQVAVWYFIVQKNSLFVSVFYEEH